MHHIMNCAWLDWLLIYSGHIARIAFTFNSQGLLTELYDNQ